ncbi:unknown protein [Simkania negevensis Z]|uniref:Uncharacterized protein n=1 Tax=Simkania negevensis (strain ATCC VR-1471 / DSM 27360 / Z) TaxID=331113 RepID=F8L8W4_SIMNZ|nr:unknown protein [Simkania negevensis Z]
MISLLFMNLSLFIERRVQEFIWNET